MSVIDLESQRVGNAVIDLTAAGMSTLEAIAHAAQQADERRERMTTGFAQDDYINGLCDRIAELEKEIKELTEIKSDAIDDCALALKENKALREQVAILTKQPTYGANHCKIHDGYGFTSDCVVCNAPLQEQDK